MIFALSDTHLSFSTNKPMDKFGAIWRQHPLKIQQNCQKMLKADDILLLPGDLSWASKLQTAEADLAFLANLPGQKILLAGNHDYWWSNLTKMRKLAIERNWTSLHFLQKNAYLIVRNKKNKQSKLITSDLFLKQFSEEIKEQLKKTINIELQDQLDFTLLVGCKGYLLPPEYQNEHDAEVANREYDRLLYSYGQGLALLKEFSLPRHVVNLLVASHYPPCVRTYLHTVYTQFYSSLASEFKFLQVVFGHLHGLGIKESVQGMIGGGQFRLVSADALNFMPLLLTPLDS